MGVKSIREGITKFVRDALESRDVVQEIKTVEIHIEEFIEYLKNAGLGGLVGEVCSILMDMRGIGDLIWYYDHEGRLYLRSLRQVQIL
jgi:2-iminoacetate synthase ThiH